MGQLRQVARGWRWGRPAALPRSAPAPVVRSEAGFETEWARERWAMTARGVIQELALLPVARFLASPRVSGTERLSRLAPPVLFVANHASHLDTSLVIASLPQKWRERLAVGAAADYFFTGPVRGHVSALALNAFPVERKRASAVSARLAVRLVEEGWSLILFPEGGRSEDGWLQEMKPGAAFIAAKTGRPLVPLWLSGTDHLWPKGSKKPRRGEIDVLIGDPLWPEAGEGPRDLHSRLEAVMRRLGTEATSDWWTALRTEGADAGGPSGARWRRIWERGTPPQRRAPRWP